MIASGVLTAFTRKRYPIHLCWAMSKSIHYSLYKFRPFASSSLFYARSSNDKHATAAAPAGHQYAYFICLMPSPAARPHSALRHAPFIHSSIRFEMWRCHFETNVSVCGLIHGRSIVKTLSTDRMLENMLLAAQGPECGWAVCIAEYPPSEASQGKARTYTKYI